MDYSDYKKVKDFEKRVHEMGFKIMPYKWGDGMTHSRLITIEPADDNYPHYSRDASIFTGTINDINCFLSGIEWNVNYLKMLKLYDKSKVERKEQDERNRKLMRKLKEQ